MKEQLDRLVGEMVSRGIRYEDALAEFEKRFIVEALRSMRGNLGQTAERLGMHRNTLRRKLQVYRIPRRLISE
jgi:DNA-binding NtrC family response regulator